MIKFLKYYIYHLRWHWPTYYKCFTLTDKGWVTMCVICGQEMPVDDEEVPLG